MVRLAAKQARPEALLLHRGGGRRRACRSATGLHADGAVGDAGCPQGADGSLGVGSGVVDGNDRFFGHSRVLLISVGWGWPGCSRDASVFDVGPCYDDLLFTQPYCFDMMLRSPDPPDVDFLLEDKAPDHDDFLLHDRQDGNVAFLPDLWHRLNHSANGDAFHHDLVVVQVGLDGFVPGVSGALDADPDLANSLGDNDPLRVQRHR